MWFAMMKSLIDIEIYCNNRLSIDKKTGKPIPPVLAAMDIFVFDGMTVYSYQHNFNFESLICQDRSRSWLSENPLFNAKGWAPGWRNASDFDEILPTMADGKTPCYLPKDLDILVKNSVRLFSLTANLNLAKFGIKFREKKTKTA